MSDVKYPKPDPFGRAPSKPDPVDMKFAQKDESNVDYLKRRIMELKSDGYVGIASVIEEQMKLRVEAILEKLAYEVRNRKIIAKF